MKGEGIVGLTIVGTVIIIGLVLRYGASSVPLANAGVSGLAVGLNDLTLKGTGYGYYPPGSTVSYSPPGETPTAG